jgi:hypothetical protein
MLITLLTTTKQESRLKLQAEDDDAFIAHIQGVFIRHLTLTLEAQAATLRTS